MLNEQLKSAKECYIPYLPCTCCVKRHGDQKYYIYVLSREKHWLMCAQPLNFYAGNDLKIIFIVQYASFTFFFIPEDCNKPCNSIHCAY